jgi:pheromone shutdown protein TraB
MITLLGVGHVFDIGRSIRSEILARRPKVVALELDPIRYHALRSRSPRAHGLSAMTLLAQFQIRIARQYGVEVGDEMIAAARAAEEIGSEIALIDQDSRTILRRVWQDMSLGERVRLLASAVGSLFTRKEKVEAELQRFYRDEPAFLQEFARELPTAKRILIDERDAAMGRTIRQLAESKGDVVAVVGEGHLEGLVQQLAGAPLQVVHLETLRSTVPGPNASASVSVQL